LTAIGVPEVARFKADLVKSGKLSDKRINNILAVLSKALRYAEDAQVIDRAPRVRLFKVERPEIEVWEYDQYARLLAAAQLEGLEWYVAACLAGEAGMRIGEVRALRWREDVDLVAGTITVNQQMRKGKVGTPKGRTRRVIPMTDTLEAALKGLAVVREGHVVRQSDGKALSDARSSHGIYRICRRAGLPERGWHALRHLRNPRRAARGELVEPSALARAQADRRDDDLRPLRRCPPPADSNSAARGRGGHGRPRRAGHRDARCPERNSCIGNASNEKSPRESRASSRS
jgi:integrase